MLRLYNEKILYLSFLFLSLTLFSSALLLTPSASADTSVVDDVSITVQVSCTLTSVGNNSHNATINPGTYVDNIGTTTLKVFCNDNGGFAIYAIGFTGDAYTGADHTKLIGANTNQKISTGTATGSNTNDPSNWAMKLTKVLNQSGENPIAYNPDNLTITNGYGSYSAVPDNYTKVASYSSTTDFTLGAKLETTYAAFMTSTQPADTYSGKVKYTLVHPSNETPAQPQITESGKICYYANTSTAVGTMGCQTVSTSATSATLFASNFSRTGYGFAGWSDAYDYATNPNANFYGPNEDISFTAGQYTGSNPGLSLYAVWVKSVGNFQNSSKVSQLCGTGTGSLTATVYNNENDDNESTWSITAGLSSISALTDTRDNQTYAIAKLSDGKCWMIENLRLDNTAELTTTNTHNPLNDGTNVTLKHNYTDTVTYNTLSATNSQAYDETSAPNGWCTTHSADCTDQSRLRTDNTANRVTYTSGQTMSVSAKLYSYGNYYNWYSATAGHGVYSTGYTSTIGDICPFGWHLPTGDSSGEFRILTNSLGSGMVESLNSSSSPTAEVMSKRIRHFPNNFLYSGYVNGSSIDGRGGYIKYWSSSVRINNFPLGLSFNSGGIFYPSTGNAANLKYRGWTVRCMAGSGNISYE